MTHFLSRRLLVGLMVLACTTAMYAQATQFWLSHTTLSGAVTATQQTVTLASASASAGATVGAPALGQQIWVADYPGEAMIITTMPTGTSTTYGVRRGVDGTLQGAHVTGADVLTGPPGNFYRTFPNSNVCVATAVPRPYVNVATGDVGLCLSSVWSWTSKKAWTQNSFNF